MASLPRSILIPTDFSPTAEAAVALGAAMAAAADAELHLLHVRVLMADPALDEGHHATVEGLLSETDQKVLDTLKALHTGGHPAIRHHVVRGLSVAESILEAAAEHGIDLIVMGTHGRRGIRRFLLGSAVEEVVRTSPVPVLTVRAEGPAPSAPPKRILVGCDFSPASRSAVEWAGAWARATGATVTLAHAVEPVVYPEFYAVDIFPEDLMGRITERSREAMEALAAEALQGVTYTVDVLDGPPAQALAEAAENGRHDLLVVGHRGLSGLEELLLGSVAAGVVRKSRIPVLTVRGNGSGQAAGTGR